MKDSRPFLYKKRHREPIAQDSTMSSCHYQPKESRASSSQMHNVNHVHVDEEAVETSLAISNLRSGKYLPDSYKDHPFYQGTIDEEILVVVEE